METQIDSGAMERFIALFLPEAKIMRKDNNELRLIGSAVAALLESVGLRATIDTLFSGFQNLSYPVAVIEPVGKDLPGPYTSTNSHKIYIGVDTASLRSLKRLSKALPAQKGSLSPELGLLYERLINFAAGL